jgi:hypothetical protein
VYAAASMDLRRAIGEYVTQGRELLRRLRSPEEGPTVSPVDLHILQVQLFLLENQAANMRESRQLISSPKAPDQPRLLSLPVRRKRPIG